MKDNKTIIQKVSFLVDIKETSKSKLGELIRGGKGENTANIGLANRFLEGKKTLDIEELCRISEFYNKPIEYFLYGEGYQVVQVENNSGTIQSGNKGVIAGRDINQRSKPEQAIEMAKAGLSEEFIEKILK